MQKFWKSVKIWQIYREFKGGNFFWRHNVVILCTRTCTCDSVRSRVLRGVGQGQHQRDADIRAARRPHLWQDVKEPGRQHDGAQQPADEAPDGSACGSRRRTWRSTESAAVPAVLVRSAPVAVRYTSGLYIHSGILSIDLGRSRRLVTENWRNGLFGDVASWNRLLLAAYPRHCCIVRPRSLVSSCIRYYLVNIV